MIALLIILYHIYTKFTYCPNIYSIKIGKSSLGDRGVISTKSFKKDDIIEECPIIYDKADIIRKGILTDYLFNGGDGDDVLALGYCSMYNHSDDNNASWTFDKINKKMTITTLRDIVPGEEIFINYGPAYWDTRKDRLDKK